MVAAERTTSERPTLTRVTTSADELRADLQVLAERKIWFGHHSVGSDVLDGVKALAKEAGVVVAIGEGPIGENGKAFEKIKDFEREAMVRDAELVVMKLCYADFTPETDALALADAYEAAVARVRAARPDVRIVHVTPPLTVRQTGAKARISRMIGRAVWDDDSNLRRLEYSERILIRFAGETILDLGLLESTTPDGTREMHLVDGPLRARMVPYLWSGWSRDGGHLNDDGKRMAARAFVRTLVDALRS